MKKVFDVTVRFTLDAGESAEVLNEIWKVWGDEPPEWLVGLDTVSEGEPRDPTEDECDEMGWEMDDAGQDEEKP